MAAYLAFLIFRHVQVRVQAWKDPWSVIDNQGYQITQSLFAMSRGSWFGLGIGQGTPKMCIRDRLSMLLAFALILGYVEALIPLPFGVPGMKLGLPNLAVLITMYRFEMCIRDRVGDARYIFEDFEKQEIDCEHEEWLHTLEGYKSSMKQFRKPNPDYVDPEALIHRISEKMKPDGVYVADVGQNQIWSLSLIHI